MSTEGAGIRSLFLYSKSYDFLGRLSFFVIGQNLFGDETLLLGKCWTILGRPDPHACHRCDKISKGTTFNSSQSDQKENGRYSY